MPRLYLCKLAASEQAEVSETALLHAEHLAVNPSVSLRKKGDHRDEK